MVKHLWWIKERKQEKVERAFRSQFRSKPGEDEGKEGLIGRVIYYSPVLRKLQSSRESSR